MTNESCCSNPRSDPRHAENQCPVSGTVGKTVYWLTVAALTRGCLPPRQEFRLCDDPDCEVVYFGSRGHTVPIERLNIAPAFKNRSDDTVCYCFGHTRAEITDELERTGGTRVFDSIQAKVEAGNCACEVRNPSGGCCLGEVRRTIHALEAELTSGVSR